MRAALGIAPFERRTQLRERPSHLLCFLPQFKGFAARQELFVRNAQCVRSIRIERLPAAELVSQEGKFTVSQDVLEPA